MDQARPAIEPPGAPTRRNARCQSIPTSPAETTAGAATSRRTPSPRSSASFRPRPVGCCATARRRPRTRRCGRAAAPIPSRPPEADPVREARPAADAPGDGPPRLLGGAGPARTTAPALAAAGPFARLPQPGTDWWQFVRREAVVAVKSPAHGRCVVVLAGGRELEVGDSADAVARQIPGLVRLTQPGTQRCLYVRPSAVAAVTAPSQGCVLILSNGRELEVGEAAAAAAGLIAGAG
jgi:hypothetical protein